MQWFGESEVSPKERDDAGFGLHTPKDRRSTGQNCHCEDMARFDCNQALRVEKPLPQRIEVNHRRNRDDRAATAADQRQHDTWIERMFRDAMSQRKARHGGGHCKENKCPEAEERVSGEAENGDHERDRERRPSQSGEEGQAETRTALMNLQERGDPGHDR